MGYKQRFTNIYVLIIAVSSVYAQPILPYQDPVPLDPKPTNLSQPTPSSTTDSYQFGEGGFRGQTTIFNPDVPDAERFEENVVAGGVNGGNSLLLSIKKAINRLLGLLAFIALLFLLYGGFKILIAGTDDAAVDEAKTIVKNAAMGILFIALSWIIVTFIFYIAGILTEDNDDNTTSNSLSADGSDPAPTQTVLSNSNTIDMGISSNPPPE